MKVHHLNCGTMRPAGGFTIVCHCLLLETPRGLCLVDTGFGIGEAAFGALPGYYRPLIRPALLDSEAAYNQVIGLGHDPRDVRDIVVTHLDADHAGGLRDFPWARVHLHAAEHAAATRPATSADKGRYRSRQWAHGADWMTYDDRGGETLFGLSAIRPLCDLPDLALVPLAGHSRGHSGVAVDTGTGWLLHAGDAYWYHGEVAPSPHCPRALALTQRLVATDHRQRLANLARLRELPAEVRVFSAHDPHELDLAVA
ncbi:MBL fold metallo-hydrolase [Herbidospora solisilvae]|nr:MBL fold metallo-hydrolase [Herbidospora solisilvae]